jgi:hypothetical protein
VTFVKHLFGARRAALALNTWNANTMKLFKAKPVSQETVQRILNASQENAFRLGSEKKRYVSHQLISIHHVKMIALRKRLVSWATASHPIALKRIQPIAKRIVVPMVLKLCVR